MSRLSSKPFPHLSREARRNQASLSVCSPIKLLFSHLSPFNEAVFWRTAVQQDTSASDTAAFSEAASARQDSDLAQRLNHQIPSMKRSKNTRLLSQDDGRADPLFFSFSVMVGYFRRDAVI